MRRILAAAATATLIGSGAALAQAAGGMEDMHGNVTSLQDTVNAEFARIGVDEDAGNLTLNDLAEVLLILNDDDVTGEEQASQIELIIQN